MIVNEKRESYLIVLVSYSIAIIRIVIIDKYICVL